MATSLYLTSSEGRTGKSTVALGLVEFLNRRVASVGVFRPLVRSTDDGTRDMVLETLLGHVATTASYEDSVGVTYEDFHADVEGATTRILSKFRALERSHDVVIVVGSDYSNVSSPTELAINGRLAANLGAPLALTVSGKNRSPEQIAQVAELAVNTLTEEHGSVATLFVTRADPEQLGAVRDALASADRPAFVLPEHGILTAGTVAEVLPLVEGELLTGDPELLAREIEGYLVCGMTPDHVVERLGDGQLTICPGDRGEMLLTLLAVHASPAHPSLSAVLLNGGYEPSGPIMELVRATNSSLPVIKSPLNTFQTAQAASSAGGSPRISTPRKVEVALNLFAQHVDGEALATALDTPRSDVRTPLMFQADLLDRARQMRRTIVLPEAGDDRVLRAASTVLERGISDIVLLGEEAPVRARASELGVNLADARVISPSDPERVERFAQEYAHLRAKKGVTLEEAREKVQDVSYFGTMMVHLGEAHGMVSGAAHTTAHTIVPSFQIIKTKPDTSIVSSVFFMCLEDRVLVYGDCAVNPDPTAEQLADIAISSAETAAQFDVAPRIAMLSYSTGASGSGADVDKVRRATELVQERRPDLEVVGPIQYDAAVDEAVATKKLPGSTVAGHATVFVFPDLNTGNNTYKAVQRSAGALAIGPVLQGLNKPVNDLSRGALVDDIVNTIAITAIQAQA